MIDKHMIKAQTDPEWATQLKTQYENGRQARACIDALDAGNKQAPQPCHGMTQKQWDRYLHFRMAHSRSISRMLAMGEDK